MLPREENLDNVLSLLKASALLEEKQVNQGVNPAQNQPSKLGIRIELQPHSLRQNVLAGVRTLRHYNSFSLKKEPPKTSVELTEVYTQNFMALLQDPRTTTINCVLIGSGKLGFSPRVCFYALISALQDLKKAGVNNLPKICIYINEPNLYLAVLHEAKILQNLIVQDYTVREADEISKLFTVILPDHSRKMMFLSHYTDLMRESDNAPAISNVHPNLYLTRILRIDEAGRFKIERPKLKLVISVVEDFEIADGGYVEMGVQTAAHWRRLGVMHFQLPVRDNTRNEVDFPLEQLARAVGLMRDTIDEDGEVLVHCRAGKSRSATVVMAYLKLRRPSDTNEQLREFIRTKRPQIHLRETHFKVMNDLYELIAKEPKLIAPRPLPAPGQDALTGAEIRERINQYLASPRSKYEIAQSVNLKQLKRLAIYEPSNYLNITNDFFAELCVVKNIGELIRLVSGEDKLKNYKQAIFRDIVDLLIGELGEQYREHIIALVTAPVEPPAPMVSAIQQQP